MKKQKSEGIHIIVPSEVKKEMKIRAIKKNLSLKDYILSLFQKDLKDGKGN